MQRMQGTQHHALAAASGAALDVVVRGQASRCHATGARRPEVGSMLRFRRRYSQNCGLEAGPPARDRRAKPTRPGASTECATTGRQVKGKGRVTEISRQQICKCERGKG